VTNSDWKDPPPAFIGLSVVKEHSSIKGHSTGVKKSDVYETVEGYLSKSNIRHNKMVGVAMSIVFKIFNH
jgi:hypothetical protein